MGKVVEQDGGFDCILLVASVAVFGMLLGDTVILNTLDDANSYRQEVRVCVQQ